MTEAAKLPGVSATTVQSTVERGELKGWRTQGGHRRISQESIRAWQATRSGRAPGAPRGAAVRAHAAGGPGRHGDAGRLRKPIALWPLPLRLLTATDGVAGLLLIERNRPDLLTTELAMPPMDGLTLLRLLCAAPGVRGGEHGCGDFA